MPNKIAFEEHFSNEEVNRYWDGLGLAQHAVVLHYRRARRGTGCCSPPDYPYETMEEAASWFDKSLLSHNKAHKVGRSNALRLFNLAGASEP